MPLYGMEEMELKDCFAVWSENQGQDDLTAEWQMSELGEKGTIYRGAKI